MTPTPLMALFQKGVRFISSEMNLTPLAAQMASCGEASFYQQHCPDTKMDGDGDGVPCADMCR